MIAVHPPNADEAATALAESRDFGARWRDSDAPLVAWQTIAKSDPQRSSRWRLLWLAHGFQTVVRVEFSLPAGRAGRDLPDRLYRPGAVGAAAAGGRAIGVDSDQYQTVSDPALQAVIMTSMLKRVDNAVEQFINDYAEGNVEGATDIPNDLSTEGIDLATSGGFIDDIQTDIDQYKQQIIDGTITVPTTIE